MAKITFFELEPWEKKYLARKLKGHQLKFVDAPVSASTAADAGGAEIVGCFIYSKIGPKELARWPKVKMITTLSTGYDHIDLAACAKKGVKVCYVPSYGSHTVAEHALALMLALSKKIIESAEHTRQGNFSLEGLRTFDLEDKTLGLIGFGKIGSHLAKTAKALGMHVRVYDPHADANLIELLTCKSVSLDELLRVSDVISLHCNLTPENTHMINAAAIAKMKKGVIVINTARGGLIDNKALV
ncbi:MAG: hydroxyacid dehydrogenase, partial [Candidatus Micrarchaeota archaeon]|nr:hydroxyacid dehydrogenase [Candidatus Micrarchaeota archaeon]